MSPADEAERARILVVDDRLSNVQILVGILKHDYDVYFAASGEKALDILASRRPDLVLLDVMMPGMDGFEVCSRLKADPQSRDIPVIFITALEEMDAQTRGLDVGAIDFITKPINPPIVKARVRNHLLLKQQNDLLRQMSFVDGLTGIANRRRFDEALPLEWRRCQRNGTPMSLLLVDVDCFKTFNDHYGHLAGDECLRAVAAVLAGQARRPYDLVARYGGEEFVCLLPETDLAGAKLIAERMRAIVSALGIEHACSATAGHVTISLGGAVVYPGEASFPEEALALADQRLYQAKVSGRNRGVIGPWTNAAARPDLRLTPVAPLRNGGCDLSARIRRDILTRLLRRRLGSQSVDYLGRLEKASEAQLDRWIDAALDDRPCSEIFDRADPARTEPVLGAQPDAGLPDTGSEARTVVPRPG
jgi:diguanylate cyclase (GGDEF)-like protein